MELREEAVLTAQLTYYRLRADQYDQDLYQDPAVVRRFETIVADLAPGGRTLELACGTGIWTGLLAARASSLTAVDGSPEMLARARQRLGTTPVTFVEADLFHWRTEAIYDTVFFAFWLSHVPPGRFETFWRMVSQALVPDGRVLFVDTGPEAVSYTHLVVAGAEGSYVWDYDGNRYLDFSCQLVNTNIGHQHPKVVAAIKAQADRLCTVAPQHANDVRSEAARLICELAPDGMNKVFFTNCLLYTSRCV